MGDILFSSSGQNILITHIFHVPGFKVNLLSVRQLHYKGLRTEFDTDTAYVLNLNQSFITSATFNDGSYILRVHPILPNSEIGSYFSAHCVKPSKLSLPECLNVTNVESEAMKWHQRLGHIGKTSLKKVVESTDGIPKMVSKASNLPFCEVCAITKRSRSAFKQNLLSATEPLELVHIDIAGPYPNSMYNHRYFIVYLDDHTRRCWVFFLINRQNMEIIRTMQAFIADAQAQTKHKVKLFHSDNELNQPRIIDFCNQAGVAQRFSVPYTPQQNSRAERIIKDLKEQCRAMMEASHLPISFWIYAIAHAAWIKNRTGHASLENKSPLEKWTGQKPSLAKLRVFGCVAFPMIQEGQREAGPLAPRGTPGVHLGMATNANGYLIWFPNINQHKICREVEFDKNSYWRSADSEPARMDAMQDLSQSMELSPLDYEYIQAETYAPPRYMEDSPPPSPQNAPADQGGEEQRIIEVDDNATDSDGEEDIILTSPQQSAPNSDPIAPIPDPSSEETPRPTIQPHSEETQVIVRRASNRILGIEPEFPSGLKQGEATSRSENVDINQTIGLSSINDTYGMPSRENLDDGKVTLSLEYSDTMTRKSKLSLLQLDEKDPEISAAYHSLAFEGLLQSMPVEVFAEHGVDDNVAHILSEAMYNRQHKTKVSLDGVPMSLDDVQRSDEWPKWKAAMQKEYDTLMEMGTFKIVPSEEAKGKNIVGNKWVLVKKYELDGKTISKYKARLVAQGFMQRYGIDYDETFTPLPRLETLRTLLAISCYLGYQVLMMDVVSAYLNGWNQHDIFMSMPTGFTPKDKPHGDCVLKVVRSLYGLKASGREWYLTLSSELKKGGFEASYYDPSIFSHSDGAIVCAYVDDLFVIGKNDKVLEKTKEKLLSMFKMTVSSSSCSYVGIVIERPISSQRVVYLHQRPYIEAILNRFDHGSKHSVKTPMDPAMKLNAFENEDGTPVPDETKVEYLMMIGSLLWLSQVTRPNISFAVGKLARYSASPGPMHFNAVKHLLRYLRATVDLKLEYKPRHEQEVIDNLPLHVLGYSNADNADAKPSRLPLRAIGFADADFAGDLDSRKSTSGFVLMVEGMLVQWSSRLQSTTSQSTLDAEYIAISEASRKMIIFRGLVNEVFKYFEGQHFVDKPLHLLTDSSTVIANTRGSNSQHTRVKHLDVKYHYILELVQERVIGIHQITTNENIADVMTKPLNGVRITQFCSNVGLLSSSSEKKNKTETEKQM